MVQQLKEQLNDSVNSNLVTELPCCYIRHKEVTFCILEFKRSTRTLLEVQEELMAEIKLREEIAEESENQRKEVNRLNEELKKLQEEIPFPSETPDENPRNSPTTGEVVPKEDADEKETEEQLQEVGS